MSKRQAQWLVVLVVGYGGLLTVLDIQELVLWWPRRLGLYMDVWRAGVGVLSLALCLALLFRARRRWDALALAVLLTWLHVAHGGYGFAVLGEGASWRAQLLGLAPASSPWEWGMATLFGFPTMLGAWMTLGALWWVAQTFPRLRDDEAGAPGHALALSLCVFVLFSLADAWYDANPERRLVGGSLKFGFFVVAVGVLVQAGRRMILRYRLASNEERATAAWLFAGVVAAICVGATFMVLQVLVDLPLQVALGVYNAVPLLVMCGAALAIFYTGRYDARLALRKTTVYGLLALITAVTLGVAEEATTNILVGRFGISERAGLWVGSIVSVAVIGPAWRYLERRVPHTTTNSGTAL